MAKRPEDIGIPTEQKEQFDRAIKELAGSGIPLEEILKLIREQRGGLVLENTEGAIAEDRVDRVVGEFSKMMAGYIDSAGRQGYLNVSENKRIIKPVLEMIVGKIKEGKNKAEVLQLSYEWCLSNLQLTIPYKRKVVGDCLESFIDEEFKNRPTA